MNNEALILTNLQEWSFSQEVMSKSVVQVVAQVARFNWREPYKVQDQFESRGSGFVIHPDGYVITNAHVVDEAMATWIHIPALGRRAIFTDVVGICPDRDMALLRVKEADRIFLAEHIKGILPLPLGDSDQVHHTDQILVLGYPLSSYTMKSSTGIVSGRESYGGYSLIQITAPINPGNSGGPVLNAYGHVIGIAIATMVGAHNIGYAIPINELKIILEDLLTTPFVRRGFLGFEFNYGSDEHARLFHNPMPAGVYINKVYKNSLFAKAGVQEGDMLYAFNGLALDSFGDVTVPWSSDKVTMNDLTARLKDGEEIVLIIYRQGKRLDIGMPFMVTDPYPIRKMYPRYEVIDYDIIGGMIIMQLTENHLHLFIREVPFLIKYARPENKADPVLVIAHIVPGSLAQQSRNLVPGFIIAEINGQPVTTLDQMRTALLLSAKNDLMTVKTSDSIFTVFPFTKMLQEERQLAKSFAYPLSKTVQELLQAL